MRITCTRDITLRYSEIMSIKYHQHIAHVCPHVDSDSSLVSRAVREKEVQTNKIQSRIKSTEGEHL